MSETETKKKVLILDDDKFLLSMYSGKFIAAGVSVETVETGEELLIKLKSGFVPDLLLLDVIVPGITGLEALEEIRKQNLIPTTKIIMLTNESEKSEVDKAHEFNIDGYIIKALSTPSEVVEQGLKAMNSSQ